MEILSIHDVLSADVPQLGYCIAAEAHGLGQCRCNSHPPVWRRDGEALTQEDWSRWYAAIDRYDALSASWLWASN